MASIKVFCHKFTDQAGTEYYARAYEDNRICSTPDPAPAAGMVLEDTHDNRKYLVFDVLPIFRKNRIVYYIESYTRTVNAYITVSRFSQAGSKNVFGRPSDVTPETIAIDLPAFITTGSTGLTVSPDSLQPTGKIHATIQACDIQVADRVSTDQKEVFLVEAIDRYAHKGLLVLTLSPDNR
jgi:hypothetical protein